jgi:hypothetical protein
MSDTGPVFSHTLQREIDDLREQAMLLSPGRKRNRVLARADARSHDEGVLVGSITDLATTAARQQLIFRRYGTDDKAVGRHPRRIPCLQSRIANGALKTIQLTDWCHRFSALVNGSTGAGTMGVGHGGASYRFSRDSAS